MIKKLAIFLLLTTMMLGQPIQAEWTPGKNEIGPDQDTYVSVAGALGNPTANYGGSESLDIGDGLNGITVTAIRFDLSGKGPFSKLEFKSDVTVFDSSTRKLFISVFPDLEWNELAVTGIDNPFNASDLAFAEESDSIVYQSILVTGSTDKITVAMDGFLNTSSSLTLVFAQEFTADGWITMSSKESPYLNAFSNPPHLEYTMQVAPEDGQTGSETAGNPLIAILLGSSSVWVWKRRKKSRNSV